MRPLNITKQEGMGRVDTCGVVAVLWHFWLVPGVRQPIEESHSTAGGGGWGGVNQSELSEGVGGAFGRLNLFNTATDQELLDCDQSKAHDFQKEWE